MNYAARWLALWNNTAAPDEALTPGTTTNAFQWRPIGKNVNGSTAYSWNISLPDLPGSATPSILRIFPEDLILGASSTLGVISGNPYTLWAISLKPGSKGQLLWIKPYPAPSGNVSRLFGQADAVIRVFTMYDKETMQWNGFSLDTGNQLWGPTQSELPWNFYSGAALAEFATIGSGKLFTGGYGGTLTCYDLKNGSTLWKYNNTYAGLENPYGNYPLSIAAIADGKIYLYTSEHSPNVPPYKGVLLRCIDISNGKELWTIPSWLSGGAGTGYAVADGYFAYVNLYDMQVYSIGKGPSATTVSAPQTVVPLGNQVILTGTVTDQSEGRMGTPAVSDDSMSGWMQYLYMQKSMPTNSKGVQVHLTAIDPNGNSQDIGIATSDIGGTYGITWTPPVPGTYQVTATFEGTDSYGNSYATTHFAVGPANVAPAIVPTQPPNPTPTQSQPATPTIAPTVTIAPTPSPVVIPPTNAAPTTTYIAIGVVVIIIIAAAAALILRRRK